MAYRTFVDKDGAYWQVWDSQPTRVERRLSPGDRRAHKHFAWRGVERRTGQDRRLTSQKRITLAQGYGAGWLTFESLTEKRRLIPVPSNWENIPQSELRALCDKAKPVAKIDTAGAA
jgi:hypothetical protein